MSSAFIFLALYASGFLVPVKADLPLAVGGHGKIFFKPGEPLASARVWVEVDTPFGWTNATIPNATEVRVDAETGSFELEAIVGDARRRDEIKGLRLFIQEPISGMTCWYRELDPAYMYLYTPGRGPTRPFSDRITLLNEGDVGGGLSLGEDADYCFHRRLAVDVMGRIMCNESEPMPFARMEVQVKKTNGTYQETEILGGSSTFKTGMDGSYQKTVSPGLVKDRDEVEGLRLWFKNLCKNVNRSAFGVNFPLDYMYAYEQGYDYKAFNFSAQMDTLTFRQNHAYAHDSVEEQPEV